MGLRDFFKPRQDKFLQSLIRQAEITLVGMDALEAYMTRRSEAHAKSVRQAEEDAGLRFPAATAPATADEDDG